MTDNMSCHTKIQIVEMGDWRLYYINGICYDRKMTNYELLKKIEEKGKPIFVDENIVNITHEMLSKNNDFLLEMEAEYTYHKTMYWWSVYKNINEFLKYHYKRESKEHAKVSRALKSVSQSIG